MSQDNNIINLQNQIYRLRSMIEELRSDDERSVGLGANWSPPSSFDTMSSTPDGSSGAVATPVRKTLERNPTNGEHKNEWQLRNVGDTTIFPVSQSRVPVFVKNASNAGDLTWKEFSEIALPFTNFPVFDNTTSPPKVTFSPGKVSWGTNAAVLVTNAGPLDVQDQYFYGIKVTYGLSGGSYGVLAEWIVDALEANFADTGESITNCYYQFKIVDGKASIKSVMATGNWRIPSVFNVELPSV